MGGGSYSYIDATTRASRSYANKSAESIFVRRDISPDMDPMKFTLRESRDSVEHPESFPIIIALDETGSMGRIPHNIIQNLLPNIIKKLIDLGIPNPQICFMGIGDAHNKYEDAPIQVGQFESSDELMEHWLKNIYIESLGQGNGGEDYSLAWYIAAYKTVTDSYEKRGKKGILITIGDEPCHKTISKDDLYHYVSQDDNIETSRSSSYYETRQFLKDAQKKWEVYHFNIKNRYVGDAYESFLYFLDADHIIRSNDENANDLSDILPQIIYKVWKQGKTDDSLFEGVEVGD